MAAIVALGAALLVSAPGFELARGVSLDMLTGLRWAMFGPGRDPAASAAVVIAIDEESYRTPPFKGSPTLTWTGEIGRVLTSVLDGGAAVVGFDIVLPASIEQSEIPFGDAPLGARLRGFDRDFLRALATATAANKVVLGEILQRDDTIGPAPGQRIAVNRQRNIRALNVYSDADEIVRRVPLAFSTGGRKSPSMAVELASRALGIDAGVSGDAMTRFNGHPIAGAVPNTLTLNFEGGADDIPTYSLADLRACVEKGDREFFRRQFAGKVVIVGAVLDQEDRKLTSKRFATGIEGVRSPRCASPAPTPAQAPFRRATIAGVHIHATAVNNLIAGGAVQEFDRLSVTLVATAFAAIMAVLAFALAPTLAGLAWLGLAYVGLVAGFLAIAAAVFRSATALPLSEPFLAGFITMLAIVGMRFVAADKEKRLLRESFGLYLAPHVIERLVESETPPKLGGEIRTVTVFFSDVAGFSAISERLTPDALVGLMNEYLSAMTDIIEDCGGYVDKYIGDSIVAVFGAPVDDPDHARNAVRAALLCRSRLEELNRTAANFRGHSLAHRIGLCSGEALVGNIGSRRRFNYTVMSDTVNLAARLDGANKYFLTSVMASETTFLMAQADFVWRELDAIRVVGRLHPVRVYEPLAAAGEERAGQSRIATHYAEGLARWRERDFAAAAACFARVAGDDPPSAQFLQRAQELVLRPPGPEWEPVCTLEGK